MPEVAETRVAFALHSPDFWRGIIIASAILTTVFIVRSLVAVLRSRSAVVTSGSKVGQVSGLISYLLLVVTVSGHQISRLGEITWSWRLVLSFLALCFGMVWAIETTSALHRIKEWHDRRNK